MGERVQTRRAAVVRRLLLATGILMVCASCKAPPAEAPPVPEEPPLSAVERQRYAQAESLLRSADPTARERAAIALLSMDHPDALATVLEAMRGAEDPDVRASIIQAAAFCSDHRCFQAVLDSMDDPAAPVQRAAADALARFTRPEEVEAIAQYLTAPETPEQQRALLYSALGRGLALPAVPVLLDALGDEEGEARIAAWEALKRISRRDFPPEPEAWREWWEANSHRTRTDVLEEHLWAASDELEAMGSQMQNLQEQHEELMALVAEPQSESVQRLLDALRSRHAVVRRYAAFRLAGLPEERLNGISLDEKGVYTILRDALDDRNEQVRENVMQLIGRLEGEYRDRLIRKALSDDAPGVLELAVDGLSATTGPEAIERARQLLADCPHAEVRVAAANVLGKVGSEEAIPALVAALDDPAENVRWFAVEGLRKLGAAQAVPRVSEILQKDDSARVRAIAASTLGELGQPAGVPALRQALQDPVERVRQKASAALLMLASGNYERMMVIAGIFRERGLTEEAIEVLRRVVETYSGVEQMTARVNGARRQMAEIVKARGDFAAAAAIYEEMDSSGAADIDVKRELIDCWTKAGNPEPAVEALAKWLDEGAGPDLAGLALETAELFLQEGWEEQAARALELVERAAGEGATPDLDTRIKRLRLRLSS